MQEPFTQDRSFNLASPAACSPRLSPMDGCPAANLSDWLVPVSAAAEPDAGPARRMTFQDITMRVRQRRAQQQEQQQQLKQRQEEQQQQGERTAGTGGGGAQRGDRAAQRSGPPRGEAALSVDVAAADGSAARSGTHKSRCRNDAAYHEGGVEGHSKHAAMQPSVKLVLGRLARPDVPEPQR